MRLQSNPLYRYLVLDVDVILKITSGSLKLHHETKFVFFLLFMMMMMMMTMMVVRLCCLLFTAFSFFILNCAGF